MIKKTDKKLYFAIINKVYSLSYLNLGYPTQYRLPDFYMLHHNSRSQAILYTEREKKILNQLHPEATFIIYIEMLDYFAKNRVIIKQIMLEERLKRIAEYNRNQLN